MEGTPCLKLRTELWKRGIRQIDVALGIKLDPARLSKMVNGRQAMPERVRKSIAKHLRMDESELF
ncbi:MAG: XRE family transcriptional regulator [Desulfobacteraceae bacterium]|nr:MAG: XRE family transcriptional regulator [Desulfobacteraceae bacterium]